LGSFLEKVGVGWFAKEFRADKKVVKRSFCDDFEFFVAADNFFKKFDVSLLLFDYSYSLYNRDPKSANSPIF
jgi:hypothetical protein